ncbi:MAG: putative bifunctional diguanylate cyclase/phosphodiesterase [Cyanophyceae cyanobacterium]
MSTDHLQSIRHILLIESNETRQTVSLEAPVYSVSYLNNALTVLAKGRTDQAGNSAAELASIVRRTDTKTNSCSFLLLCNQSQSRKARKGIVVNQKRSFIRELKHGDNIDFENGFKACYYILSNLDLLAQIELLDNSQEQAAGAISPALLPLNPHSAETSLEQTIYHSVTNLPNQILFKEHLATTFALAQRHQSNLGVLLVALHSDSNKPLERVKPSLLRGFADRVQSCLRSGDLLAHWQAETLAVLLPQIRLAEDAAKVGQRIVQAFSDPLTVDRHQVFCKSHLGIAVYPQDADTPETLIDKTEVALRRSQEQSTSNYQFYCSEMTVRTSERFKLAEQLKQAIDKDEFMLHYQPQLKAETQEIAGVEAFLRWHHPEIGQVSPSTFISLAEEMNLILPMANWTLQAACAQNKAWQQAGLPPVRMGVNLSRQQFQQPNLVKLVAQMLQNTGLDPRWLRLEITEATILQNVGSARRILQSLRDLGVGVALDDFGTGYFSLADLQELPLSELKIAHSIVQSLDRNPATQTIARAAIAIGEAFGLSIVAEGVETAQQLETLRQLGCSEMQGYYFSKPLGTADMTAFFHQRSPVPAL